MSGDIDQVELQAQRVYEILSGLMLRLAMDQVDQRAVVGALACYLGGLLGRVAPEGSLDICVDAACKQLREFALAMAPVAGNG
jgi:hypothetical protein